MGTSCRNTAACWAWVPEKSSGSHSGSNCCKDRCAAVDAQAGTEMRKYGWPKALSAWRSSQSSGCSWHLFLVRERKYAHEPPCQWERGMEIWARRIVTLMRSGEAGELAGNEKPRCENHYNGIIEYLLEMGRKHSYKHRRWRYFVLCTCKRVFKELHKAEGKEAEGSMPHLRMWVWVYWLCRAVYTVKLQLLKLHCTSQVSVARQPATSNAGAPGLIPGQGNWSHMLQLRVPHNYSPTPVETATRHPLPKPYIVLVQNRIDPDRDIYIYGIYIYMYNTDKNQISISGRSLLATTQSQCLVSGTTVTHIFRAWLTPIAAKNAGPRPAEEFPPAKLEKALQQLRPAA